MALEDQVHSAQDHAPSADAATRKGAAINTYGVQHDAPWWKLFEVDGWQLLVAVEPDEDDDDGDHWAVRLTLNTDATLQASVALKAPSEKVARQMFDGVTDGRRAIQGILDQVGPMLAKAGA